MKLRVHVSLSFVKSSTVQFSGQSLWIFTIVFVFNTCLWCLRTERQYCFRILNGLVLSVYFRNTVNHSRYLKPGGTCLRYDGLIKECYKIPTGTILVALFVVAAEGMQALSTVNKRISFTVICYSYLQFMCAAYYCAVLNRWWRVTTQYWEKIPRWKQ
jgi:hypothetical protein